MVVELMELNFLQTVERPLQSHLLSYFQIILLYKFFQLIRVSLSFSRSDTEYLMIFCYFFIVVHSVSLPAIYKGAQR